MYVRVVQKMRNIQKHKQLYLLLKKNTLHRCNFFQLPK